MTQRIVLRPPNLLFDSCISSDIGTQGIQLDDDLPFNITSSNTILLLNCTNAMLNLQAPINCTPTSLCHNYINDNAAACTRSPLCCVLKISGSQTAYVLRIHDRGCLAYQIFVNIDTVNPPKKWPQPGLEIEWTLPQEPACKTPVDCDNLFHSKCLPDPANVGTTRCFCSKGFKWDPLNGLCATIYLLNQKKTTFKTVLNMAVSIKILCSLCLGTKCRPGRRCKSRKKHTVLVSGISAALGGVLLAIMIGILVYKQRQSVKKELQKRLIKEREKMFNARNNGRSASVFTGKEIRKARGNYSAANLIGSGGFGEVFKGLIKSLMSVELEQPLMIYEFVPNGTLFNHLHCSRFGKYAPLTWQHRLRIAHQTAESPYLHSTAVPPIYHREVKPINIFLDEKLNAKVSDFGLSWLVERTEGDASYTYTSAQGTIGYLDPEYYRSFQLTDKSDVYSFGVLLLGLLTSKKAIDFNREDENVNLVVYMKNIMEDEERLIDVVDPVIKGARKLELDTIKALVLLAASCLDD
ncbi:Wall-associated receptor kinase-like 20 [Hibiscus syriacus]|uniref:Wall-associated receptor kinase-like 20 n=1 Tax=Hibiscus syriacus TaxID=106335 RepID=A0A6A3BLX0_HIBSY|nr:Wall-associated receptor kinase-like 20 [Hibiscus syriacus]